METIKKFKIFKENIELLEEKFVDADIPNSLDKHNSKKSKVVEGKSYTTPTRRYLNYTREELDNLRKDSFETLRNFISMVYQANDSLASTILDITLQGYIEIYPLYQLDSIVKRNDQVTKMKKRKFRKLNLDEEYEFIKAADSLMQPGDYVHIELSLVTYNGSEIIKNENVVINLKEEDLHFVGEEFGIVPLQNIVFDDICGECLGLSRININKYRQSEPEQQLKKRKNEK